MNQEQVVAMAVGIAFLGLGVGMSTSRRLARWGLSHGRARMWVSLLGEERAVKIARLLFAPMVVVMGLAGIAMGFLGLPAAR